MWAAPLKYLKLRYLYVQKGKEETRPLEKMWGGGWNLKHEFLKLLTRNGKGIFQPSTSTVDLVKDLY